MTNMHLHELNPTLCDYEKLILINLICVQFKFNDVS